MNDETKLVRDAIPKFIDSLDCFDSKNYCEMWNGCYPECCEYADRQMIENIDKFVKILLDFRNKIV